MSGENVERTRQAVRGIALDWQSDLLSGFRSLVVHDNAADLAQYAGWLALAGSAVSGARTLDVARARLAEPFDLIVVGRSLPDGDGYYDLVMDQPTTRACVVVSSYFPPDLYTLIDGSAAVPASRDALIAQWSLLGAVREAFRRIGRSLSCGGLGAGALPRIGVSRAGWYKASNHSGFIVKALPGHVLKVPPVRIDKITRATTVFDRPITLRPKEFDVLVIMMENKGRAISQRELLSHVWKQKVDPRNSIVRNQIAALRRALGLGSGFIQTASGGLGWGIALEE